MGNFEDHLRAGLFAYALLIVAAVVAAVTEFTPLTTVPAVVLSGPIVIAGALFPDIDHHASKPHKAFKRLMSSGFGVASIVALYMYTPSYKPYIPLNNPGFVSGVLAIGVALLVSFAVNRLISVVRPKHRGLTHRFVTGLVVSIGFGISTFSMLSMIQLDENFLIFGGSVATIAFLIGFLSHIYKDGLLLSKKTYTTVR